MKRVLFISQEIVPYVAETAMSVLGRDLPQAIFNQGCEIRTFMPKWGNINERRNQLHEVQRLSGMNLIINDTDHPLIIKVASIPNTRVQVYFIDNKDYFARTLPKDDATPVESVEEPEAVDNGERAIFYARGVLETVKKLRWKPDVIHCQGWMSAVIPYYLKTAYKDEPCFDGCKVVCSLFDTSSNENIGSDFKEAATFESAKLASAEEYKKDFDIKELGKLAVDYSDGIVDSGFYDNAELLDRAEKIKCPILIASNADDMGEIYNNFYASLLDAAE